MLTITFPFKKGPFGVNEYMDRQQGLLPPSSFVPHYVSEFVLFSSKVDDEN